VKGALRWLILVTVVVSSLASASSAARADHLDAEVSAPQTVAAGEVVQMRVVVRLADSGARVPGAVVVASRDASMLGIDGTVEIARSITDRNGIAILRWREHSGRSDTVIVAYAAAGEVEFESVPESVVTEGLGSQIVRSNNGVRIPGLGAWVLIALLVGVWAIIQFAMIGPIQVSREAEASRTIDHAGQEQVP